MYLAPLVHQYEPSYLSPQRSNLLMILHGQPQPRLVSRGDSLVGSHPAKSADICLSKAAGPRGDFHPRSAQPPDNSHLQLARANFATTLSSHGGCSISPRPVWRKDPARGCGVAQPSLPGPRLMHAEAPPPPAAGPAPSRAPNGPVKKSRPGRCTPARASVRRPRLA